MYYDVMATCTCVCWHLQKIRHVPVRVPTHVGQEHKAVLRGLVAKALETADVGDTVYFQDQQDQRWCVLKTPPKTPDSDKPGREDHSQPKEFKFTWPDYGRLKPRKVVSEAVHQTHACNVLVVHAVSPAPLCCKAMQ